MWYFTHISSRQFVDIESARSHIGGDQYPATALAELHQHLIAVALLVGLFYGIEADIRRIRRAK
jgi:hypothetical protein